MNSTIMKSFYILFLFSAFLIISEGTDVKIINGHEAQPNSRPYMAYIVIKNQTHNIYCGGSLIKPNWVITAAHCSLLRTTEIYVILGSHLRNPQAFERGRQIFSVEHYIKHPNYNENSFQQDIQLMKLFGRAMLNCKVQLLPLPVTDEDVEAGTVCDTAGWGQTEKGQGSDVLMEVGVSAITRRECQRRFYGVAPITENNICTSVGTNGEDACFGDSGGPLICKGVFRGIVSFGRNPCWMPGGAVVYARLTKQSINWINKITAQ